MNMLLVITLAVAIPVYALHWHNQPARTQKEKTTTIEAAFTFLFNPYWPARITALVAHWLFKHFNKMANRKDTCSQPDKNLIGFYDNHSPSK